MHMRDAFFIQPGWKNTRNFVMRPFLHVHVPINTMRLFNYCFTLITIQFGHTPLDIAKKHGCKAVVDVMVTHGELCM